MAREFVPPLQVSVLEIDNGFLVNRVDPHFQGLAYFVATPEEAASRVAAIVAERVALKAERASLLSKLPSGARTDGVGLTAEDLALLGKAEEPS